MRILIAEDETIIRLDLRDLLERSGHEVVAEARDGEEAIELAREHAPELAIMDVKMPKLDGIDAAIAHLREHDVKVEDWHEVSGMVRLSTFYDPDGTSWMLAQVLDQKDGRG